MRVPDLAGLGITVFLYLALALVLRVVYRGYDETIRGSPRSVWVHGVFGQILFATLATAAACTQGELQDICQHLFMYCFVAHLTKDFLAPMDAIFILHHVGSYIGVAATWTRPDLHGDFVAVIGSFEIGSGALGLWVLNERSTIRRKLFLWLMPLSNAAAMLAITRACWHMDEPLIVRVFFFFLILAFAVVRQRSPLLTVAAGAGDGTSGAYLVNNSVNMVADNKKPVPAMKGRSTRSGSGRNRLR
jgi:hypothetical protein